MTWPRGRPAPTERRGAITGSHGTACSPTHLQQDQGPQLRGVSRDRWNLFWEAYVEPPGQPAEDAALGGQGEPASSVLAGFKQVRRCGQGRARRLGPKPARARASLGSNPQRAGRPLWADGPAVGGPLPACPHALPRPRWPKPHPCPCPHHPHPPRPYLPSSFHQEAIYLGKFPTQQQAGRAHDIAALKLHGPAAQVRLDCLRFLVCRLCWRRLGHRAAL
jgi:hypothetical protein